MEANTFGSEKGLEVRVNQLFEKNNVQTVRVMQNKTKEDIELKKQKLRTLVGDRYRDLIQSADSIIHMKTTTEDIRQHLHSIEEKSARLQHIIRSPLTTEKRSESSSSHYFTIANEIKELVDTPEKIWVALEQHNYLNASDMYLEAFARYEQLRAGDQNVQNLLKSIPLLSRQWATINQFPSKIESQSYSRLLECDVTSVDLGRALYALSQLRSLSIENVFEMFISTRMEAVKVIVTYLVDNKENSGSNSFHKVKQLARVVQQTIIQTAVIFVSTEYMNLEEREILMDSFSAVDYSLHRPLFVELLRSSTDEEKMVSIKTLRNSCTNWIKDVAKMLQDSTQLLDQIKSAEKLIEIEQQVWEELHLANIHDIWISVRKMLLPDEYQDLWGSVFHQLFFAQAKQIIIDQFNSLTIASIIDETLHNFSKTEEPITTGRFVWEYVEEETLDDIKNKSNGVSQSMLTIVSALDEQLASFLKDFEHLVSDKSGKKLRSSTYGATKQTSIVELREFIQNYCYESLSSLINGIGTLMGTQLKHSDESRSLDKILFLAQLSQAIAENSVQIPLLLPNSNLSSADTSRFSKTFSYISLRQKVVVNPLKEKLTRACQLKYVKGYIWWAMEQSNTLTKLFEDSLYDENWSNSTLRKSTWTTIEVSMKADSKEQIKVPNFPSAFVSRFLFNGCQCFHEQTAHAADSSIIRFFTQIATQQIISVYERFLSKQISQTTRNICREGLVQILFDVRYIFDIFAGAYQSNEEWPETLKEAMEVTQFPKSVLTFEPTKRLRPTITAFISALKKHFEPIDLAFYEPRIQQYVQKSYIQNVVSLGYFTNTKRLYAQAYVEPNKFDIY